jgi:hypothetical protein
VEFGRIPDAELDDFTDIPQGNGLPYPAGRPELDDTVLTDNIGDLGAGGDGH